MANPLTDIFTGKPGKDAAKDSRAYQEAMAKLGIGVQQTSLGNALPAVQSGFGNQRTALGDARGDVSSAYNDATGSLDLGNAEVGGLFDRARGDITGARGEFDTLAGLGGKYGAGTSLYLDSLGVNGPEGLARASASFQPSMAYNFNLEQGLDAINRRRNAGGMLNSGNADRDAQTFGAGLASREFGGWQDRLGGLISPELSATGGAATGRATAGLRLADLGVREADAEATDARTRASLATGRGAMLADLQKAIGSNYAAEGPMMAGLWTGYGKDVAGNLSNTGARVGQTYKDEADAEMAGSKNMWGLGMAAAQMAMGMPPTSLGSLGGGSNPSSAAFGSNPFTPSGNVNPAYMKYG